MSANADQAPGPAEAPAALWSRLLRPGYLLMHLVVVLLFLITLRLGWWQWERARLNDWSPLNLSYALQWPVFGLMGVWYYVRMMQVEVTRDPDADEPGTAVLLYQRPRIDTSGDPELAAYNAHLAELNERVLRQRDS
ncbi:metalloprotease [Geodermatophilus sp. FMUSA9-8]|uniref:metalloprotease n=1 Tax=Geodermatophilus sp. FMUSA9-8 TaxID=3120155 RepID=UPI003007FF43